MPVSAREPARLLKLVYLPTGYFGRGTIKLFSNGGDSFASGKRQQERALVRLQAASSNGANG
jgi:hypothetical protein